MIALALRISETSSWLRPDHIAASLGVFAGGPADQIAVEGGIAAQLRGPRQPARRGWTPAISPDGTLCLLEGWLDNRAELARLLECAADTPDALLFAHAVEHFGEGADRVAVGSYAAICRLPDATLRLSRSPWGGPSLFWAGDDSAVAAASLPRILFAAGHRRVPKRDQLADALLGIFDDEGGYWYEGVERVPQGTIVTLRPGEAAISHTWYDPHALPETRLPTDQDYQRRADKLLHEAAEAALARSARPGLMLSGGLDSALVADALLGAMPDEGRLRSYTFVPAANVLSDRRPGMVLDEREAVEAFAAMHPRLDPRFVEDTGGGFDARAEAFFAATDTGPAARMASTAYHGCYRTAAEDGCDWVLDAACGNDTISQDARWAHVELLKSGKWGELAALTRNPPADDARSFARRLAARSLLPLLPRALRRMARQLVHGSPDYIARGGSLMTRAAFAAHGARAQRVGDLQTGEWPASRREWLERFWLGMDMGTEQHHGFEQVFGIRQRDVLAYRPLIEFCAGLPTSQFVRGGQTRFLARQLAKGRMPESQRLERRIGLHNAGRFAGLSARRTEIEAAIADIESHPQLSALVDTARARTLLRQWPQHAPADPRVAAQLLHALPGAVMVSRFARWVEGRNDAAA
ncbi:asparagine synthase-related protein [Paraurantiacibacter namhicola]|uniref:Asparagine synthase n=1 Tax=Paraurantiacibacter namhicola TaxID=645517 RepID=A0A1C7D5X0_9SPHN|nr:asparagine synthase-related protein [Paraurantiacibacter namhicola]ANU06859.1 Asparagine synthase [Paraurantiacibacter namhicola]